MLLSLFSCSLEEPTDDNNQSQNPDDNGGNSGGSDDGNDRKNDSATEITFRVYDTDDWMADPFFAKSVCAGKCTFASMSWSDSTFEENGITVVEEIELSIRVYDADDWFSDDLINKTVTLVP